MKNIEGRTVYSVTEVNNFARRTLENLSFWVEGEISEFKGSNNHYRYIYFSLKDSQTEYMIPCKLEPEYFQSLDTELEDGKKVLVLGSLTLWEKMGKYQMFVHKVEDFGEGFLLMELEELKRKLAKKGYFDPEKKKELPSFPTKIAVITSSSSNAWHDFRAHSIEKYPFLKLILFDVLVQGSQSAKQVIKALRKADKASFDAIVITRGGGSLEDLASFNNERLADEIFKTKTCVVVGVGHEKDVTIAQLVADIQASTPTDAAKIITSDFLNLESQLENNLSSLKMNFLHIFSSQVQNIDSLFDKLSHQHKSYKELEEHLLFLKQNLGVSHDKLINQNIQKLKLFSGSIFTLKKLCFEKYKNQLKILSEKIQLLSPENTLKRGYSITTDLKNKILKDVSKIALGSKIKVKLARGIILSKVLEKEQKKQYE